MIVDARFEKFLNSLPNPLQLNDMRTMKNDKFDQMRDLLSAFVGSPILRIIKDNLEVLELDPDVFDLVYEGFWDLYTFKNAQLRDISARKLQSWIQRVKLTSGPDRSSGEANEEAEVENEGDDAEEEKEEKPQDNSAKPQEKDVYDPATCVVRLRIPKVPVEPEMDDEGNPIDVEVVESDLDDIPFEDRCP